MSYKPRWQQNHEARTGGPKVMWKPGQVIGVPKGQRVEPRSRRVRVRPVWVDIMLVFGAVVFLYWALYRAL